MRTLIDTVLVVSNHVAPVATRVLSKGEKDALIYFIVSNSISIVVYVITRLVKKFNRDLYDKAVFEDVPTILLILFVLIVGIFDGAFVVYWLWDYVSRLL